MKKRVTLEHRIHVWLEKHSFNFARYALAIIFIWFGILKPLKLSTANELVANTVYWFNPVWFLPFLGIWEVIIGLCLLYRPFVKTGLILMAFQMVGTFLPLIILPEVTFISFPWVPSLEGQYIIKNLVLIAAAMLIGSRLKESN